MSLSIPMGRGKACWPNFDQFRLGQAEFLNRLLQTRVHSCGRKGEQGSLNASALDIDRLDTIGGSGHLRIEDDVPLARPYSQASALIGESVGCDSE
ncbi:MAG: hypothetical protein F4X12_10260 [Acidobacteriia bacterium]|nr:hypothetical protein [Terriglobia bacterium]